MLDVLGMLDDNLRFIRFFYDQASEPFRVAMQKIERHEEPYNDFDPEDGDPPYLSQWLDNNEALNLIGKACLCMVQQTFKDFLDHFIKRSNQQGLLNQGAGKKPGKGSSWFVQYRDFFEKEYHIDWGQAPVDLKRVEDINLTRNDIQHNARFYYTGHEQSKIHFENFPDSLFADPIEREFLGGTDAAWPCRIVVTGEALSQAIQSIYDFCSHVDGEWQKHPI